MGAGIWGVLASLPEIFKFANGLLEMIKDLAKEDPEKAIKEIGEVFGNYSKAKSKEERREALRGVQKLIGDL